MSHRLIYVTDLHGAIDRLELLLELTAPDVYIVSGDLLYNPFATFADMEAFTSAQAEVRRWFRDANGVAVPLLLRARWSQLSDEQRHVAETYNALVSKARRTMRRKYRALERLTALKPRTPIYFLPGNYDLDLSETALAPLSLHRRLVHRTPLGTIGGYGGAPVYTPGVPEHLAVKFREQPHGPGAKSDPLRVLQSLDPDVTAVHVPPLGILDGSASRHYGSWGIREYLDAGPRAKLLLCGHVHESWGAKLIGDTWVVNSGAFGAIMGLSGYHRGGYFAEIDVDPRRGVQSVILKRLERTKIWHLVEYQRRDGRLEETVVEPKRIRERRADAPVASEREAEGELREFTLEELALYNQIKLFMRRFETVESEQRIDDLREMVRRARERGTEIAFDVLGSLNMGQSTATSDVDAILYIGDDPARNRYDPAFWPALVHEVSHDRYKLDITDLIDLWEVREAIDRRDPASEALQRFVVYRTIARPVNVRLLRIYDDLLIEAPELKREVQERLRDDLRILAGTASQTKSFDKYLMRLRESGVRIPPRIATRIHRYLHSMLQDGEVGSPAKAPRHKEE